MLFECGVEGGLGIEPGVHGDVQDAGFTGFAEALFRSCDAMLVNKVKEIATRLFIDDLRQVVGGNPQLRCQLRECQCTVQVRLFIRHVALKFG